jgi:hypothetical protein
MLRIAPALALFVSASAAQALEIPPVCKALHELADAARSAGPQRLSLSGAGCERTTPGAATAVFCAAVSGQPAPVAAWQAAECVNTMLSDAQVFTGKEPSGFRDKPMITRLAAKLGGGVRLDLSQTADRYDLTVWKKD